jgi:hypothetical protein
LAFSSLSIAYAQNRASTPPSGPKTRIEAFESQAGTVIVRGYSKAGELKGVFGGVVRVQAMEFADATNGKKEYGIGIDVTETDRIERSNRSFIDYDEIASLLKGIEYVSKLDKSVTPLEQFQADFRTKGDFRVSTFSSSTRNNEIMATISSGSIGETSVFVRMADLLKFRDIVVSAKGMVDSARTPK